MKFYCRWTSRCKSYNYRINFFVVSKSMYVCPCCAIKTDHSFRHIDIARATSWNWSTRTDVFSSLCTFSHLFSVFCTMKVIARELFRIRITIARLFLTLPGSRDESSLNFIASVESENSRRHSSFNDYWKKFLSFGISFLLAALES